MMWQKFKKDSWAIFCLWILGLLCLGAVFADFLMPYSFKDEAREFSYCPPTAIYIMHEGKLSLPFVYVSTMTFDEYHRRVYQEDRTKRIFLKFFQGRLFTVDSPGRLYLLGADGRGRDIFSRIFYGARISLSIGFVGVAISFLIGLCVGGIAGYFGGRVDQILMRVCEMMMMLPGFYLLLALRAAVPQSFNSWQVYASIIIILSFIGWASLARVIRGMCLSLKEREYVLAAKSMGVHEGRILWTHILPHTVSYSLSALMLSIPGYILSESALSLIGLGIQDPYASWGNMLSEGLNIVRITFSPWILWPALFIFLTILCFNIIGDALRDLWDPTCYQKEMS